MDVVVGRVAKAHGIRGELAVEVRTDSPEERFAPGVVVAARLRDGSTRPLTFSTVRTHGERLLVRFDEVPGRNEAEELRGALLLADTDSFSPNEDPDEFYDHELEGLDAVLTDGSVLGKVREVLHSPGGELLAITADGREVLVPFVREIVPEISIADGRVVIDPPDGLLD